MTRRSIEKLFRPWQQRVFGRGALVTCQKRQSVSLSKKTITHVYYNDQVNMEKSPREEVEQVLICWRKNTFKSRPWFNNTRWRSISISRIRRHCRRHPRHPLHQHTTTFIHGVAEEVMETAKKSNPIGRLTRASLPRRGSLGMMVALWDCQMTTMEETESVFSWKIQEDDGNPMFDFGVLLKQRLL
jgi:hypothetical protein